MTYVVSISHFSEPALVGALKLVELKFFLELGDVLLGDTDLLLGVLIKLFDLLGRHFGVLRLELLPLHHVYLETLDDKGGNVEHHTCALDLTHLLRETTLEDVEDFPLLFLLTIIKADLDLQLFLFLLLTTAAALLLCLLLSTPGKDATDAPNEDEPENGTTKQGDQVQEEPFAERRVLIPSTRSHTCN